MVEECDVIESKRDALREYRRLRQHCLEHMRGPSIYPVYHQLSKLAWHTAVFQTLNEAKRLEPDTAFNGPTWELLCEGYTSIMSLGIRRMLDVKKTRISLAWIIEKLQRNRHLLKREFYVCHDGLPYDYKASRERYDSTASSQETSKPGFHPVTGLDGWGMSRLMHEQFDKLCGHPSRRSRDDEVSEAVINSMKALLSRDSLKLVENMANKIIAHTAIIKTREEEIAAPTLENVSDALEILFGLANFVCAEIFFDSHLYTVVPIHSRSPTESLGAPQISQKNASNLSYFWKELCISMNQWTSSQRMNELIFPATQQPTSDDVHQ